MSIKQCAAVRTNRGAMSEPPQKARSGLSGSVNATAQLIRESACTRTHKSTQEHRGARERSHSQSSKATDLQGTLQLSSAGFVHLASPSVSESATATAKPGSTPREAAGERCPPQDILGPGARALLPADKAAAQHGFPVSGWNHWNQPCRVTRS